MAISVDDIKDGLVIHWDDPRTEVQFYRVMGCKRTGRSVRYHVTSWNPNKKKWDIDRLASTNCAAFFIESYVKIATEQSMIKAGIIKNAEDESEINLWKQ